MKKLLTFFLTALLAFSVGWAETATLSNANIVNAGAGANSYKNWTISDDNDNTWSAYAIKNQHSNATSSYHYLQIKKYASNTAYYIQVPEFGTKITQIVMTVSGSNQPMTGGGNSATLYFSNSNSTSATGTGVASGTGTSSVTIDCSSLDLNSGYITAGGAVRIWDVTVTYETGGSSTPMYYHKVKSTNDIVEGKKYLIVYEEGNKFLGAIAQNNTSNYYGLAVDGPTISGNQVDISGYSDIKELTLGNINSTNGSFTLHNGSGYLCYYSGDGSNPLNTQSSVQNYSRWRAFSDAGGYVLSNGSQPARYIQYDSDIQGFSTYNTTTNAKENAYLYVEGEAPVVTSPVLTIDGTTVSSDQTVDPGTEVTLIAESGNTLSYTIDGSDPSTSSTAITTDSSTATVTVNSTTRIRAIALDENNYESSETDYSFTVPALAITLSPSYSTGTTGNAISVAVSANTSLDVVYSYSVSPDNGATVIEANNGFNITANQAGSYTVTVEALDDANRTATATGTYEFTVPSANKIYKKVTSSSGLTSGDYLIVWEGDATNTYPGPYAFDGSLTTLDNAQNFKSVTINNNQIETNEDIYFTYDASAGTLRSASGYYIGRTASGNGFESSESIAYQNGLSIEDGHAVIVGSATTAKLQYFKQAASSRFRYYTSTQQSIQLYKLDSHEPTLLVSPDTVTISDAAPATLIVTAANLTDNITTTLTPANDWSVYTNLTTDGGTADVSYAGRALSAGTSVKFKSTGADSVKATVNYVADLYIVTDNGVTGDWHFNTGTHMTCNNGTYTADFAVTTVNTFILFARKLDENALWNTRLVFGPQSDGDWMMRDDLSGVACALDLNDDDPIYFPQTGLYTITINANDSTFTITKRSINVTISPADGTHFQGETISGTITSDPAGTIEWCTDGTNWQTYDGGFTATVANVGSSVTVYARSTVNGIVSDVTSATYTRDYADAPASPTFSLGSGEVAEGTVITITAPEGTTLYVNGEQVTSPYEVTINHNTTITAYCVNDEGTASETVTNTYTIATICSASIVFDNSTDTHLPGTTYGVTEESDYDAVSDVSTSGYLNETASGIRFGSGSNSGSMTISLDPDVATWKVSKVSLRIQVYGSDSNVAVNVSTSNEETANNTLSGSDVANYEFNFSGAEIESFTISNNGANKRFYLKSIALYYDCAPEVEAPVISPATGTYYGNQTVHITADEGCTIYYTTNGTTPTTASAVYNGAFTAAYTAGSTTTIKAIAVDEEDNESEVATAAYTWATPSVTIRPDSRVTSASVINVTMESEPAEGTIYYTTDGSTPTAENGIAYTGGFTVSIPSEGDAVTVKAVTVYNGMTSPVATATYTHMENALNVNAPFFSPLQNQTYYGDQTLQIGCTTPNTDIYYEIVEVSGETAPAGSTVSEPTHMSTYYDGTPIEMSVGNSYYVKAIAYVGNYVSTVSEGWYIVKEFSQSGYYYQNLKDFNDNCPTGVTAHLVNPVQVVYHSTYTNNGEFAEFCYVRDNTDYACIYFGKRDTGDNTIFKMGDWIDGSQIAGVTNIWERNFHIQLGTNYHQVTSWPSSIIGWSEIIPEEMTNDVIVAGTADGSNSWGHYVHLRNTTLREVQDYSDDDPKHTGKINDGTADAYYYDKFYRWSAGTCSYTYSGSTYTDQIQCLGDYDQAFFTAKQAAGAKFDVYGIVDYYSEYNPPFEICPIDFLWAFKPRISLASDTYHSTQTVTLTAEHPDWAAEGVVIYYKTDDMEEWAVYTPGQEITVNSDTHLQAYAEVLAEKTDGTNYNDYVRSEVVEATYDFVGVEDPIINPESQTNEVVDGSENVSVTVQTNSASAQGTVTLFTTDGSDPRTSPTAVVLDNTNGNFTVTENTTVNAVSYLTTEGNTIWSNVVTRTYEFIELNGKTYDLLTGNPEVGNIYVIVNKAANVGMSTTQNVSNRTGIGVTFTDATKAVVNGHTSLAEFMLESANAGRYYFRQVGTENYLCVTTNDNPNLMTGAADVNAEASATVNSNVTSGVDQSYPAIVTFSYEGTNRYLRYYAGGRTFTTYGDATVNEDIFLYGIEAPAVLDPSIAPQSQLVGSESLTVTVTPNDENPEGAVTYYTTDGSDPRSSSTSQLWTSENGEFDVTTTTTVKAVTGIQFGDTFVWSNVVSETYTFIEPTTLAWIEGNGVRDTVYIVADELIGTWAVVKQDGQKLLWAKDQGNASIDKRPAMTNEQQDYVKDILKYQKNDWDESNWVILDFSGITADPDEYVGHKIQAATVKGTYTDAVNFTITLLEAPELVNGKPIEMDVPGYPGYDGPFPESKLGTKYDLAYNSFVPANFMTENLNREVDGNVVGFVADEDALGNLVGEKLYFVNPKIQEVAHVWAVWDGGEDNLFTVYRAEKKVNPNTGKEENVNAWNLNGTFRVAWDYNCLSLDPGNNQIRVYGRPESLTPHVAYEFHAVAMKPVSSTLKAVEPQGTANPGTPSADYMVYPLDMSTSGTPTAVIELNALKTVVSVSYYNLMGQESRNPFEGVNIVVTRYSDGSVMTRKVLR